MKRCHPNRHRRIVAACPTGKRAYPTRYTAKLAAKRTQPHRDSPLFVYIGTNCCGQYHLTSLDRRYHYGQERDNGHRTP